MLLTSGSIARNRPILATAVTVALAIVQGSCNAEKSTPGTPTTTASLAGISLNPTSVVAGVPVPGTVSLTSGAPTGTAVVSLTSSNTAVATVPANVTVAAGATTATFIVTTVSAGSSTIAASYSGASQSAALTVTSAPATPSLLSIALDSPTVVGGGSVNGTVALTSAAPAGGAVVSLQSSDAGVAMIPSSVTVPAGATNASFTVTTRETGGEFRITLTGSYSGTSRSVLLVVAGTPPPLALVSLSISPSTIVGGGIAQGTATLNQMAPSGGTVVTLSSDAPAVANVPGSVTVTAGTSAVTFPVVSSNTTAVRTATISASYNNVTRTATLTVNPALVATFVVSGPSGSDTCKLLTPGTADCTFDGRPSSGPIVAWEFTYLVGSQSVTLTTGTGQLSPTFPGCSFFPAPSSVPPGATFLPMEVRLKVRDSAGAASGETVNRNVRVLPNAQCGFGF